MTVSNRRRSAPNAGGPEVMSTVLAIDDEDVAAARALRSWFAHFWSTQQGEPREVYDRFVAATSVADGTAVAAAVDDDPGPGIWVRPSTASPDRVLLFLHGGGYGLGSAAAYVGLLSHLAASAGVAAFALEYPLAPEAQLPDALDLAVETLSRLRARYSAVAVAGDSAGGGLALASAAQAVRRGIDVAALAAFSPWTDLSLSGTSVAEHAVGDPLLDPQYLRQSAAAYLGDAPAEDPRASPLFDVSGDMPPCLLQVGTDEILRDDSRRYAEALRSAGGDVQLQVWQGMHHVFQLNVDQLAAARAAVTAAGDFLATRLSPR